MKLMKENSPFRSLGKPFLSETSRYFLPLCRVCACGFFPLIRDAKELIFIQPPNLLVLADSYLASSFSLMEPLRITLALSTGNSLSQWGDSLSLPRLPRQTDDS